ncbi:MAG: hypothetical protein K2M19_07490 [Muribaculaceae bacterium]|nr:hypothetical protein [Muribaculaceae bacterium]
MRTLLYILILLAATACGFSGSQPEALDEAQRLMHSDPASALSKLNGVDVSEFHDSATMARWALLYSEAMVINRLAAPTDTIVNIAIDYYGRHNIKDEFHKASSLKALMHSPQDADALATALYLQKEKEFFLYKERTRREMYTVIAIIILLIAGGIIVWMYQRIKLKSIQNDVLIAEASGLKNQLAVDRGDIGRLESKLHGLLDNRFALIDSLCQTYYETQGTKTERKAIVDKVKSEIDAVRSDSYSEMEHAVNACRDNLLVRVKENYPGIKTEDYQLLIYIASGLSARTISLLIGESVDVVYKRKSRLKSKLRENLGHTCPDIADIF